MLEKLSSIESVSQRKYRCNLQRIDAQDTKENWHENNDVDGEA
jgi:hypothetical protein